MRPLRKPSCPSINALAEDTPAGCCVLCDAPVKRNGRGAVYEYPAVCASKECRAARMRMLVADRRLLVLAIGKSVQRLEGLVAR